MFCWLYFIFHNKKQTNKKTHLPSLGPKWLVSIFLLICWKMTHTPPHTLTTTVFTAGLLNKIYHIWLGNSNRDSKFKDTLENISWLESIVQVPTVDLIIWNFVILNFKTIAKHLNREWSSYFQTAFIVFGLLYKKSYFQRNELISLAICWFSVHGLIVIYMHNLYHNCCQKAWSGLKFSNSGAKI